MVNSELLDTSTHGRLHLAATRDDAADAYCPLGMKALEIFEIAIEKWVLVIPLNFKRDCAVLSAANVINLVTYRFSSDAINNLAELKIVLRPMKSCQSSTQPLRHLGLPTAASNDLRYRKRNIEERAFQFFYQFMKIVKKYGFGMAGELKLEASIAQTIKHGYSAAISIALL